MDGGVVGGVRLVFSVWGPVLSVVLLLGSCTRSFLRLNLLLPASTTGKYAWS